MLSFSQTQVAHYSFAPLSVGVALAVTAQIEILSTQTPFAIFFPAVAATIWLSGRGPGVLAIILSVVVAYIFIVPSIFATNELTGPIHFATFIFSAGILVWLTTMLASRNADARKGEVHYGFLFESSPYPMWIVDPVSQVFLAVNDAAINAYGYSRDEFLTLTMMDFSGDENTLDLVTGDPKTRGESRPINVLKHQKKDGSTFYFEITSHEMIVGGRNARLIQTIDVTERIRTSDALKASESRLSKVFGNCPVSVTVNRWNDGVFLDVNAEFLDMTGWTRSEILGHTSVSSGLVPAEIALELRSHLDQHSTIVDREIKIATRKGKIRNVVAGAVFVEMLGERCVITTFVDVTELRGAEARHRASEERLRIVTEKARVGLVMINRERRFTFVNSAYADIFDLPTSSLSGRRVASVHTSIYEKQIGPSLDRAFAGDSFRYELRRPTPHGDQFYDVRYEPTEVNGSISSVVAVVTDITDRTRAELARQASEELYRTLFEYAPDGIAIADCDSHYVDANETLCRMLGYTRAELIGLHAANIFVPKEIPHLQETLCGLNADLEYYQDWHYRRKDGSTFPGEVIATKMPDGNTLTVIRDITERKQLEDQLLHAQKMEAIGVLAGGVAHDFNNILTAISGYSELTLQNMAIDDPLRDYIIEINDAGIRAAALTTQLLAFSRRRVLSPIVHNLNLAVTDTERMLRRIVKENIEFRILLDPDLGNVKADPGQIAQVIVNLVINAGDAMPSGGTLTIATRNVYLDGDFSNEHVVVTSGPFVELTVTDTGSGMDAQTQRRLFEPFYTTKEVGKGTGLGLSTVYGIVKQSGGDISVETDLGCGSTFKVYLPCVAEVCGSRLTAIKVPAGDCGTETILMVEDEAPVRNLVHNILTGNGYKVLAVDGGEAALSICHTFPDTIHLLLTDMIMPHMDGAELREAVTAIRPGIKTLFMSGYTGDTFESDSGLRADTALIEKPFAPDELIQKIREVLDTQKDLSGLPAELISTVDIAKAVSR